MVEHGSHLLQVELMPLKDALEAFEEDCEWEGQQISLIKSLYKRKLSAPEAEIVLQPKEIQIVLAEGDAGITESRELLAAVGITLP